MQTKITKLLVSTFSTLNCYYDLITVGPYANRIAKTVSSFGALPISILTVEE
jgi:hypothetical protein